MGKGDQRTRRGKIFRGTFGKTRRHKRLTKTVAPPPPPPPTPPPAEAPAKPPRRRTPKAPASS